MRHRDAGLVDRLSPVKKTFTLGIVDRANDATTYQVAESHSTATAEAEHDATFVENGNILGLRNDELEPVIEARRRDAPFDGLALFCLSNFVLDQ